MESMWLKEIIDAVGGKCSSMYDNMLINNIVTDSRMVKSGDLFIALEGEIHDGHDFILDTVKNGASAIIVSKPVNTLQQVHVIHVDNTLKAMWQLAAYYRQKFLKPVIAVTGSVGKTSTKDMIAAVLSGKYNIHKSKGNFNNHIGMPLTVLGFENKHDAMVVEMGMRGFGEVRELTHIARPNIAVITNIGLSHIERLETQENILKAKLEIVEGLEGEGVLILNANDPLLSRVDRSIAKKVLYIGVDTEADYTAYSIVDNGEEGVSFKVNIEGKEVDVHIPAVGRHNVFNALYGIACGALLGMSPEEILTGLKSYRPEGMRLNIIEKDGIKFINDCYNASPDSMRAALLVLKSIAQGSRCIAILGNMFELGEVAGAAHYGVGKMCGDLGIDFTAAIGENACDIAKGIGDSSKFKIFDTHEEIVQYMKGILKKGDVVLIKGSRGMKMERILELWQTGASI